MGHRLRYGRDTWGVLMDLPSSLTFILALRMKTGLGEVWSHGMGGRGSEGSLLWTPVCYIWHKTYPIWQGWLPPETPIWSSVVFVILLVVLLRHFLVNQLLWPCWLKDRLPLPILGLVMKVFLFHLISLIAFRLVGEWSWFIVHPKNIPYNMASIGTASRFKLDRISF